MTESLKLVWDGSLATGERAIDVQHKYLIDIINELAEAIEQEQAAAAVAKILNLLKYYATWHFGREEMCMDRYQCPIAATNKQAHAYFVATFESFQAEFRASGGSQDLALRMYQELTDWLVKHIKGIDCQIRHCLPS